MTRLKPQFVQIPDDDPFKNCKLERRNCAESLTDFVRYIDEPYVLAIDAAWGTGKTTFVKMWERHLRQEGFSTLYFNAWEADFAPDPFVAMVAELTSSLELIDGAHVAAINKVKKTAAHVAKRFIPIAAKLATVGAFDLSKEYEALSAGLSNLSETLASDLVANYSSGKNSIAAFKEAISDAIEGAERETEDSEPSRPLIFFVDELDRCRPTFAIELLERAKHLFDVCGVVFVLSVNKEQLGHSVQSIYGPSFDGANYLRRFIDMSYLLPEPKEGQFMRHLFDALGVDASLKRIGTGSDSRSYLRLESLLIEFSKQLRLSLREQSQLVSRIGVVLRTIPCGDSICEPELALLTVLYECNQPLYKSFIDGVVSDVQVIEFFKSHSISLDSLNYWPDLAAYLIVGSRRIRNLGFSDGWLASLPKPTRDDANRVYDRSHGRDTEWTIKRLSLAEKFVDE